MKLGELLVIDKRALQGIEDIGSESLCLRVLPNSHFELSIRGYEILGFSSEYRDDDGEDCTPDFIDGKEVVHGDGYDFVLGGDLIIHKDDGNNPYEFVELDEEGVIGFLDEFYWSTFDDTKPYNKIVDTIKRQCKG